MYYFGYALALDNNLVYELFVIICSSIITFKNRFLDNSAGMPHRQQQKDCYNASLHVPDRSPSNL